MIIKNCLYCQALFDIKLYGHDGKFFNCSNRRCQKYGVNYQRENHLSTNIIDVAVQVSKDHVFIQKLIFPLFPTSCYDGVILEKNKLFSFEANKILSITEMVNKFNNLIALL